MKKNANILITGANGLLGSYIVRYLVKEGYTGLKGLVRSENKLDLLPSDTIEKIELFEGNILDFSLINKLVLEADYIIHAAAEVHFDPRHSKALFKTNVEGTAQIVDACLEHGIAKLVYISSTAALGRIHDDQEIDEKTMWDKSAFNTRYAISKHYGEREIWRGHEEGLNVGVLNPSLIITPGYFDKSSSGIYTRIFKNLNYYPSGTNGIVDVRDTAKLAIKILESEQNSLKIIACAENIKYKKLFDSIAHSFDRPLPKNLMKPFHRKSLQFIYRIKSLLGLKSDISKASLLNASMNFYYDNQLSKDLFQYQYISIEKSINQACEAFQSAKADNKNFCVLGLV